MKWIPPLLALIVLAIFMGYFFTRKTRSKEVTGFLMVAGAFFIYHLGDLGMWAGWNYELFRRIASLGYYLEIPALLYLAYQLLSPEQRAGWVKTLSWLLCVPWVVAIVLLKDYPNNFLEYPNLPEGMDPGRHDTLVNTLILFFIIGVIVVAMFAFRAAKTAEGAKKSLAKAVGWATIILLVLEIVLFAFIEAVKYDPTYLFGFISIFWAAFVGNKLRPLQQPVTVT